MRYEICAQENTQGPLCPPKLKHSCLTRIVSFLKIKIINPYILMRILYFSLLTLHLKSRAEKRHDNRSEIEGIIIRCISLSL